MRHREWLIVQGWGVIARLENNTHPFRPDIVTCSQLSCNRDENFMGTHRYLTIASSLYHTPVP